MPINKDELTKEMIEKAMQCKTAEELIALAKTGGYELTKEEAESYLAELADIELDGETLKLQQPWNFYPRLFCFALQTPQEVRQSFPGSVQMDTKIW